MLFHLGGTAIYFLLFGRYMQEVAILPRAPIGSRLQWQLFEAWNCANFFIAIGLLWAQRWARWGYIIGGLLGFSLIFFMYQQTQKILFVELLFSVPCFVVFVYLLYRKDAHLYFSSPTTLQRPRTPLRRRLGACLYVLTTIFAFWSLNAIVLGITEIYPQTLYRDKLAFLALPMIAIAEWIGKTPGVVSRVSNLAIAFSVYLMQIFLYKYASPYTAQIGPSLWQLRNWAIGVSSVSIVLLYLQFRRYRQQLSTKS
ncbi:hypothetical protein F506_03710 [Herbaspirillum hiltneri N3]|uniref:Uncharacterized protein n=2 Tax=Herbaspirillum TaxID=963 RepID=A0ABM5UXJ0_9BURK|nr:hypothetical protein F506_03710 [Herbaspirillum hiltneri N3]